MDETQDKRIAIGSAVKALGKNRFGGYLVKFTDENRRDLYQEWFDSDTDFFIDDFKIKGVPVLFHHGFNDTIKATPIGTIDAVKIDDGGIFVEAILKEHQEYIDEITKLVEKGVLGWSSGALPQAVRVADTGHIDVWPIIEGSMTHTPAAPFDTAITSIRSLKPVSLREQTSTSAREVTVRTGGGAVSSIHVEYNGMDASTNNTHTHTDIGEFDVDKTKLAENLKKVSALKALDEETRAEILDLIRNEISDAIGVMGEQMQADGQMDGEAVAAADEEAMAAAADALDEETKAADGEDDVKAVVRSAMDKPAVLSAIALAWAKGYAAKREEKIESKRNALAQAINEVNMSTNGTSKKSQAGGVRGNLGGNGSNISVSEDLRYAHLSPFQMALGVKMLQAGIPEVMRDHVKLGDLVSEDYARHATHKMAAFLKQGGYKDAGSNIAVKASMPFRADEINAGTITGQGAEWLATAYDESVWERVRDETQLFDLMMSRGMRNKPIPQGYNSVQFQTDTSSGTVYYRAEANDLTTDNSVEVTAKITGFGTGNVTVTGREHVIANVVTDRLSETSVINVLQHADQDMLTTLAEALEDALINGDTTTGTANINKDGTATTAAPARELWLSWDGIRHHFLIDNTSLSSDHATGALAATTFLNTRNLLPGAVRNRRDKLLFVIDYGTEAKARQISELFTRDVAYNDATFFTGILPPVDGVEVYTSGFLRSADTDGKVTGAGNVTDTGTLMCVYAPYWAYANQRSINIETARGWDGALSGSTLLVATVVHGFSSRSINAAAGTYNIAIA